MANNALTVTVRTTGRAEFAALAGWLERQSEDLRNRFWDEWAVLHRAGAEIADSGFCYGIVFAWVSNDFRQHCARFGFSWPEVD